MPTRNRTARPMRILVVNPPFRVARDFIDYPYFANIGALNVAAALRNAGADVRVADSFALPESGAAPDAKDGFLVGVAPGRFVDCIEGEFDAAVVCASVFHAPFRADAAMSAFLKRFRKRFPAVTLAAADAWFGGMHYVDYENAGFFKRYPEFDLLFRGESEAALARWATGGLKLKKQTAAPSAACEPGELPTPDWSMIDTANYFAFLGRFFESTGRREEFAAAAPPYLPFVASRGCLYGCAFCSCHAVGDARRFRKYPIARVEKHLAELKEEFGVAGVVALDGLANADGKRFGRLLDTAKRLGLKMTFVNGLRADRLEKSHVRKLSAVCPSIAVSAESASDRVRNSILKKGLRLSAVERAAAWAKEFGLPFGIHYMIGVPGETKAEINATLEHAVAMADRFGANPMMQFCAPLPGTPLDGSASGKGKKTLLGGDYFSRFHTAPGVDSKDFTADELRRMMALFNARLKQARPEKLIINLTYRCNNKCEMCAIGGRPKRDRELAACADLLREYRENGFRTADFDGGEPTLHPDLLKIVSTARALGYERINVTTNGRRLRDRAFASRLLLSGITDLLVSLYGHTAALHESITGVRGSFEQTAAGIRNAVRLRPERIAFGVNTVLTEKNYRAAAEIGGFIASLGVAKWNVQFPTPHGRAEARHQPDLDAACAVMADVSRAFAGRLDIRVINLPPCMMPDPAGASLTDAEKFSWHMAFVDTPPENLGSYLAKTRVRIPRCADCVCRIVCEGVYDFGGGGR